MATVSSAYLPTVEYDAHDVENAFNRFLLHGSWRHDFSGEACTPRQSIDCEASYLSKRVFAELFKIMAPYCDNKDIEIDMASIMMANDDNGDGRSILLKDGHRVSFDVMNNPTPSKRNYQRIGGIAEQVSKREGLKKAIALEFRNSYHTIGNFAPTPWWIQKNPEDKARLVNLQTTIRNARVAEWWDLFLLYLQEHMPEHIISFRDYLMLSCQFFYIDELDDWMHELQTSTKPVAQMCEGVDWTAKVAEWAKLIPENNEGVQLLSLMNTDGEKRSLNAENSDWESQWRSWRRYQDADPTMVEQTDRLICRLIEARGRCIMGLLRENA